MNEFKNAWLRWHSVETCNVGLTRKHSHYFKDVTHLTHIDVYRVLDLFGVTDSCISHSIKKLLVAGGRGQKDQAQDVQEAIDTLLRYQEMRRENGDG